MYQTTFPEDDIRHEVGRLRRNRRSSYNEALHEVYCVAGVGKWRMIKTTEHVAYKGKVIRYGEPYKVWAKKLLKENSSS